MEQKFRVGIIGCGMIANAAHLPAITNMARQGRVVIVACSDVNRKMAEETAQRWQIPSWFDDPQKMLDTMDLDIVHICTPNKFHREWTIRSLTAGAHVICEKPLSLTYREAKEMFDTASSLGKILLTAQTLRWKSDMLFAHNIISSGQIGNPYYADISCIRRYGIPKWGTFHMAEFNGGGPFCDIGVHFIDSLLWMCGNPRVVSVSGCMYDCLAKRDEDVMTSAADSGAFNGMFTPRKFDSKEFNVEDSAVGFIRLDNGMGINFKFTWAMDLPSKETFLICGNAGGVDAMDHKLYKNINQYQADIDLRHFDKRPYSDKPFDGHYYMFEHFINVLDGKEELLVKPEETLNVVSAMEAFYRSAQMNREIQTKDLEGYSA